MVLTRSAQAEVIEEADIEYVPIASKNREGATATEAVLIRTLARTSNELMVFAVPQVYTMSTVASA